MERRDWLNGFQPMLLSWGFLIDKLIREEIDVPGERLMEQMQGLSSWTCFLHLNSPAGGLECPDPFASPATSGRGQKVKPTSDSDIFKMQQYRQSHQPFVKTNVFRNDENPFGVSKSNMNSTARNRLYTNVPHQSVTHNCHLFHDT